MTNYLCCNFCGKSQKEVKVLITGPAVYICNECILLCVEIMKDMSERKKNND